MPYHTRRLMAPAIAMLVNWTMIRFWRVEVYVLLPAVSIATVGVFWLCRIFPGVHKE